MLDTNIKSLETFAGKRGAPAPLLQLPNAPTHEKASVKAWEQPIEMVSFLPAAPDLNPMFLQKRVYQGSSGEVYPLPFIDRIATDPVLRSWHAIHIENQYLRLMVLPEIGGRIHVGLDKINGYDFFYRQNVIKPALVGLAGPWISGGVEFNWPQHHRPATFMPAESEIERHSDGSVTVWCSDYDRATGMKGMHGVCLHPDRALVELKVRLYNGTDSVQAFLWWANVAAKVNEHYQSFFPPDVRFVADHAKRAVSTFPLADGTYYGVNYGERAAHGVPAQEAPPLFSPQGGYPPNDLSRYANIPVPTSYMIVETEGDFFGGYDHSSDAGFVHVADHHIAPGKKQWTWGNHEFGYAWDRSLTENDGPYVELMAGVYTDNQPDFSFLVPGETKTFSQFWYPLRKTGVPLAANLNAAIRLEATEDVARVSLCVTQDLPAATITLNYGSEVLASWEQPVTVQSGFFAEMPLPANSDPSLLRASLATAVDCVIECSLAPTPEKASPALAVEPPLPELIPTIEELYLTGLHLEQYRHATRSPEPYWREALRRDPGDARSNHMLAKLHLRRGEYAVAETHVRAAIERTTRLNPNPYDGEVFYTLGRTLRFLHRSTEAYAAFYKATWSAAWRSPAYHALAEIDITNAELTTALKHLQLSLLTNRDNLNARNLCVAVMRRLGTYDAASELLAQTRALDPLDMWSRFLDGVSLPHDNHQVLALGLLLERSGLAEDAIQVLAMADASLVDGAAPLIHLTIARCYEKIGETAELTKHLQAAADHSPAYCFPSGPDQFALLQYAIQKQPDAASFHYYLGNLLFHHKRHKEAIESWEASALLDVSFAQVWRNLGIAYFNVKHDAASARRALDAAFAASPRDAKIFYERDQLQKRLKVAPALRLSELLRHRFLVERRDDLSVELATLFNQLERPAEALDVLLGRHFQPWEGGEGLVLAQFTAAHLKLGRAALLQGNADEAANHFGHALNPPHSLGEAKHLLANTSNIYYWFGEALAARGDKAGAVRMYERSATQLGDFQSMSVQPFSEMSFWSGLSLRCLGQEKQAIDLFTRLLDYATEFESKSATIDYFATSLPALLLFEDDLDERLHAHAKLLRASALIGLGDAATAQTLLDQATAAGLNSPFAADLAFELNEAQAVYREAKR